MKFQHPAMLDHATRAKGSEMDNQDQAEIIRFPAKGLSEVIQRLGQVVEQETAALQANSLEELEYFSEQKNRLLLEFNRTMVAAGNVSRIPGLFKDIERLRAQLGENRVLLRRQLAAVNEFSGFLESEARRHETDGTYSQSIARFGMQR
jgi:flagellar biosynthesis/type III secretory pathway chaperone